ncbi:MAG: hypothetical protein IKR86_09195 [Candidatus Methanomethylophilaceae archaeon]|nr:hypothetical protein [Candidatus Methanomethylophilaceae archaeon]
MTFVPGKWYYDAVGNRWRVSAIQGRVMTVQRVWGCQRGMLALSVGEDLAFIDRGDEVRATVRLAEGGFTTIYSDRVVGP